MLAVGVADFCDLLFGDGGGDVGGIVDGVEVGDERDGDPVEAVDLVVAADDDAVFAVVAGAEDGGGVGTDVVEVDGGVAGGVEGTEGAVGFLHEKSDGGVGLLEKSKEAKESDGGGLLEGCAGSHVGWMLSGEMVVFVLRKAIALCAIALDFWLKGSGWLAGLSVWQVLRLRDSQSARAPSLRMTNWRWG